jgi:hypothetical protein
MRRRAAVYRRTPSGRRAWLSEYSGLPLAYRRILALMDHPSPSCDLVACLSDYDEAQVWTWLDELESLCFVESSFLALNAEGCEPMAGVAPCV